MGELTPMVDPVLSFAISIALLIGLLFMKQEVHIAVLVSTISFGILTLGISFLESTFKGIFSRSTLSLVTAFSSALFLSYMMKVSGILDRITDFAVSLGPRFASIFIPILIGLIPMPGGALVSAMMMKEHYMERQKLDSDFATFINYWFRHVTIPVWPVFQSIIIASVILKTSVVRIIEATYPAAIASYVAGFLIFALGIRKYENSFERGNVSYRALVNLWPFLLIIALIFLIKLPVDISLLISAILVTIYTRPSRKEVREGLKFALSFKILAVVIAVTMFTQYVYDSKAALALYNFMLARNIPALPLCFLITFIIGVTTAGEYVYTGTAFPLLSEIIGTSSNIKDIFLLMSYTGGYLGVMLSPVHLCLVLTLEYYKARYSGIYKYLVPAVVISLVLTFLLSSLGSIA
jgi:integral membrane protein (TIGR00529 family)